MEQEQREFATIALPMNVQEAMRDNLPGQVSKILRDELEKGARAIEEYAVALKEIKELRERKETAASIKRLQGELDRRLENCELKEVVQTGRELKNDLWRSEMALELAQKYADRLETTLAGLVRNTEWRESVHRFESAFDTDQRGRCVETKTPSDSTKTAE